MSDAYRVPERGIDETEIERAKIHEAGETKRKLIEETEKTKREKAQQYGPGPLVAACVIAAVVAIPSAIVAGTYIERKNNTACREESYEKGPYHGISCSSQLHIIVETDKTWACKCGTPRLP